MFTGIYGCQWISRKIHDQREISDDDINQPRNIINREQRLFINRFKKSNMLRGRGYLGFLVPKLFGFWVSWFQSFLISWFQNSLVSKFQRFTNISCHVFWNILISYPRFSKCYSAAHRYVSAPALFPQTSHLLIYLLKLKTSKTIWVLSWILKISWGLQR